MSSIYQNVIKIALTASLTVQSCLRNDHGFVAIYQRNKCKYRGMGRLRRLLTWGFHSAARGGMMRNRSISCSAETPGAHLEKGSEWNGKTIATVQRIFFPFFFLTTHWLWKSDFSTFVPFMIPNLYFAYCKLDDLWATFGTTAVFPICPTQGGCCCMCTSMPGFPTASDKRYPSDFWA